MWKFQKEVICSPYLKIFWRRADQQTDWPTDTKTDQPMHKGDYYGPHLVNLRSKIVILIIAFIGYSYWKYNAYAYSIGQPGSFATAFVCGFKMQRCSTL